MFTKLIKTTSENELDFESIFENGFKKVDKEETERRERHKKSENSCFGMMLNLFIAFLCLRCKIIPLS
jgi:hypothetical protein